MATSNLPLMPVDRAGINAQITNATNLTLVDVYDNSAGTKAVKIEALNLCSDDSSARNVQFSCYVGSTSYVIGTVAVAASSGVNGTTARVVALSSNTLLIGNLDSEGIQVIWIPAGAKLQAGVLTQVTADKTIHITGFARKYE